ncbi:MAG: N5-glutamine methyltransferase family protein, partial [Pyrinomonadaceae bacterium]
ATAVGADLSSAALEIANLNAGKHDVSKRLQLIHSDVFANVSDSGFDLIVANPPYIPTMDIETLQPEVSDFEPRSALDGGSDGLDIVRRIVDGSAEKLASGGYLLMEIGVSQAEKAAALFGHSSWSSVKFLRDLQNIERIVSAVRI